MGNNFLLLNYDNFCTNPEAGIQLLGDFLQLPDDRLALNSLLLDIVNVPASIGRYKSQDISEFDQADVSYVEKLGFVVGL